MKVRFGPFTLDAGTRQLTREGKDLHLSTKAFDLLVRLVERRPEVIDKATLRQHLWPNTHVVDASLTNLIAEIRSVLADRPSAEQLIRTVHGIGYAFSGEAREVGSDRTNQASGSARCWLVWKGQALILSHEDNIIGRDPACAIWIDAPGVSRRHARIRIEPEGGAATLEDLESTNGTELGSSPVKRPARLKDGDRIRLGQATLTFRAAGHADAPTKRVKRAKT